jgi:hypothetical protein
MVSPQLWRFVFLLSCSMRARFLLLVLICLSLIGRMAKHPTVYLFCSEFPLAWGLWPPSRVPRPTTCLMWACRYISSGHLFSISLQLWLEWGFKIYLQYHWWELTFYPGRLIIIPSWRNFTGWWERRMVIRNNNCKVWCVCLQHELQ